MTEDEDFQYVVSRQDYHEFRHSKAKCEELVKKLSQAQDIQFQDKERYLSKIERLEDELKAYRASVRQHVDRQIKQIDGLLKILNDYRSSQTNSSMDMLSLDRIKLECEKISETFNVSLRSLQIINSEVMTVIKSLVQDSLALHGKLKEYGQMYENAMQQKEDLYVKIKHLNEKSMNLEKDKEKFIKNEQKMKYQIQILKYSLKQREAENSQLEINLENLKNKYTVETRNLKEQKSLCDIKWKEILENSEKLMEKQIMDLKNDKLIAIKAMIEEIQRLRERLRGLAEESTLKDSKIKKLEIAYRQQSALCEQFQDKIEERQESFKEREQLFKNQCERSKENYERQLENIRSSYEERSQAQSKMIDDLQRVMNQQHESKKILQRQMKDRQNKFFREIQESKARFTFEKDNLEEMTDQLKKQLREKSTLLEESEQRKRFFEEMEKEWLQKNQLQEHVIHELKRDIDTYEHNYLDLDSKLALKTQEIKKMEHQLTNSNQLSHQIDQLRKVIAISQSEKTILQEKTQALNDELNRFKKLYQESTMKLNNENQQLIIQLKITVDNLEMKKNQTDQALKALNQIKMTKNTIENQYCQLSEFFEREKKNTKENILALSNQVFILQETLEQKQIIQNKMFNEIESLRGQAKNGQQARQASNLLRMDLETLENEVQRLNKQKSMIKKDRQTVGEELKHAKMQIKFMNDDLNSMKMYIDELEHNLEKLSEQKVALKNEVNLFKEEAEFCKHESIEQLGIIDHLERELQGVRKQLKNASESIDPLAIVKRSSLSKGEKAYYVKEMILEYGNQMRKNLQEIGALTPDEIKDLIVSELRELGNYVKNLEKDVY